MTTIFERETEVGRCDPELVLDHKPRFNDTGYCIVYAQTTAALNGSRRLLKIEHRCYLRAGDEMPDQPWVQPEVLFEPAVKSNDALVKLAAEAHNQFLRKAREQLPGSYVSNVLNTGQ